MGKRQPAVPVEPPPAEGDLRIQASGKEAKRILAERGRGQVEAPPPVDKGDAITAMLLDPANKVQVRRVWPKTFADGSNAGIEVYRDSCPLKRGDIETWVFDQHGGHKFQVRILDEDDRTLTAYTIENPDTVEPTQITVPEDTGGDPYAEGQPPDALDEYKASLQREVDALKKRQEVALLKESLAELRGKPHGEDGELARLRAEIDAMKKKEHEDALRGEIKMLAAKVDQLASRPPEKTGKSEVVMLIESMDQRFNKMFEMITSSKQDMIEKKIDALSKAPDEDKVMERMLKLKELFGAAPKSKSSEFEEKLLDMAMENITGGRAGAGDAPSDETDMVKFIVKEFVPVVKDWMKADPAGKPPTREELMAMVRQQAAEAAAKLKAEMATRGNPTLTAPPQRLAPSAGPAGKPKSPLEPLTPPPRGPAPLVPGTPPGPPPAPPPPAARPPAFNPRDAVNYTLRLIISELSVLPSESEAAGAVLDTWPPQLLDGLLAVDTAEGLKTLLEPHADAALLAQITAATSSNEKAKLWLKNVVMGIQSVYDEERSKAPALDKGVAEPPPERF